MVAATDMGTMSEVAAEWKIVTTIGFRSFWGNGPV